jgi:oxygen-independent coproporphyrinogen-3 oxidase
MDGILAKAVKCEDHKFSFEAHPNNISKEHLQTFYNLGFRRNSVGVQDYDPKVQKKINRIHFFETVKAVTE